RTNAALGVVTKTLDLSNAKKIYTDKWRGYKSLISKKIHSTLNRGANHIERHNLTLRTHLKRLTSRSICFSRSIVILSAV
ncbi:MAG: IS1 family transposase, partial [Prevotellaceae bacterium]|nr:IS1 family transposase [Prevotellaceae bacterium]